MKTSKMFSLLLAGTLAVTMSRAFAQGGETPPTGDAAGAGAPATPAPEAPKEKKGHKKGGAKKKKKQKKEKAAQ